MIHRVGMAQAKIALPEDSLLALGLGSCVAVALHDAAAQLAGLAHIMLPSSEQFRGEAPAKCADTAVPHLIKMMVEGGASPARVRAKLAGGAQMFATQQGERALRIGPRNVEAAYAALKLSGVPILGAAVGGSVGRTVELFPQSGELIVRTVRGGQASL